MNYIFIDESGDPGKPFEVDSAGNKVPTGASLFYILAAVPVTSEELFKLEARVLEVKHSFGYKKEIKSSDVSLDLYKALLNIFNELNIKVFYRCIDKTKYKGKFSVDGSKEKHNIFDEYNLRKVIHLALTKRNFLNTDIVIDRTDRRLLDGSFDNINKYILKMVNTKTKKRADFVSHVSSEYVHLMQMADLVSGAIKENFTGRNKDLKKVILKKNLIKIF